jgi:transglutaminase-like putative cysteine protease
MSTERAGFSARFLPVESAVRYRLRQTFTYSYHGAVRNLVHRLVVVPPAEHGDQRLCSGTVTVSDPAAEVRWHDDEFGNRQCVVRLSQVPPRLELQVCVVVDRGGPEAASPARTPQATVVSPEEFRLPSRLTNADAAIVALSRQYAVPGDVLATADAFCALSRERIRYGYDATDVNSTAAQALAAGTGVCQDQAHLMLALCRAGGIAARYVSGHLVGQGGTHAWTEVFVPGGRKPVAFDPCHARRADARYLTVAVGRDYHDVAPTSGSYEGCATNELTTSRLLESEPLAA